MNLGILSTLVVINTFFVECKTEELERPERIVGGDPVNPGEIPWQVSLQRETYVKDKKQHFCGGALIEDQWILTAAHCVENIDLLRTVAVIGAWDLNAPNVEFKIEKVFLKNYDPETMKNDIALLKLRNNNNQQRGEDVMKSVSLERTLNVKDKSCTISGWGRLSYEGSLPNILHAGKVSLKSDEECSSMVSKESFKEVYESNICAGGDQVDSCQGDSGGPLVCCRDDNLNDTSSCVLTGITSWGIGCATPDVPGIYTEVAYYSEWVTNTMHKKRLN